jgi:uncharacterized protein YodC (DUF2158 family)
VINAGTFATKDLVRLPRKPMLARVWPGNRVMLASGGPDMIVMDVDGDMVMCWWDDESGKTHKYQFDIAMLTCAGAR